MDNDVKTLELTDEQLEVVTGAIALPPININPQVNINTGTNVSAVGEGNVVLWSTVTNSSIGKTSVSQLNPTTQSNQFA